ncbi:acyl carrier protein [Dactylosporangium vinaceum]|uniref:Phosphopantetheine-binding protein n=1 Tax=Dactylosporangium vinaceum TaxID=53362 RepID=A0ABV5LY07_9ACTN|nr:phosphopantetheine-binding protein [Dactylosporangium vinaceum]UAB97639.1 acyl carrier protein [Dactylosporangium vinaceum]
MNTIEDFRSLLNDELGLTITADDVRARLDEVSGWDSVYLLSLLTLLERRTGRVLPLRDVLSAGSLHDIYLIAAGT